MVTRIWRLQLATMVCALTLQASTEVDRLAKLGEVWFKAKQFHPYLAYRNVDWRGALAGAVPAVRAAKTPDEFALAVDQMLSAVNDPATGVEAPAVANERGATPDRQLMNWKMQPDGVLIAGLRPLSVPPPVAQSRVEFGNLMREIRSAKGLVLDLRLPPTAKPARDAFLGISDRLVSLLITAPLAGPGRRRLVHHGIPRADLIEAGYYTAFETSSATMFQPFADSKGCPTVFLVNRNSPWPPFLQALVAAGKASAVFEGEGNPNDTTAVIRISLEAGWTATVRLEEQVFPDGSSTPGPNIRVPEGEGLRAAMTLLGKAVNPSSRTSAASAPIFRDAYWSINWNQRFPELPDRLAAVFQLWGLIEYFYTHRAGMGVDWTGVLKEFIPRIIDATDESAYHLALAEMCAFIKDSHLEMPQSNVLGRNFFPVPSHVAEVRIVEGKPVIWRAGADSRGLQPGDIVYKVDGEDVATRLMRLRRYISASTEHAMRRHLARLLLAGVEGTEAKVEVERMRDERLTVSLPRLRAARQASETNSSPPARLLGDGIAYIDLSRVSAGELERTLSPLANSRALVLDLRRGGANPQGAVLRRLLAVRGGPFVLARTPVVTGQSTAPARLTSVEEYTIEAPENPRFKGRVAVLMDEYAQSAVEGLAKMLEDFCGATLIGGTTTGANGNSTNFVLPGGIQITITGTDLKYQTTVGELQQQRVGVKPDINVAPSIAGLREGRDEVLERAIEFANTGR